MGALHRESAALGSGRSSCPQQVRAHRASGFITQGMGTPRTLALEMPDGGCSRLVSWGECWAEDCELSKSSHLSSLSDPTCQLRDRTGFYCRPWPLEVCRGGRYASPILPYFLSRSEAGCEV